MRISLEGRKPTGEWASFMEVCGVGDGKKVAFETPFPSKEAKDLHVMRDIAIIQPDNERRVLDPDGNLLRDEPDGYHTSTAGPDLPVTITFDRAPSEGEVISCSAFGRKPEKGIAFQVLPLTDSHARALDDRMPPELRKRKREAMIQLSPLQDMYREAYNRLIVDAVGFEDETTGQPLVFTDPKVKAAILEKLGSVLLGGFATERARTLQTRQATARVRDLSD